MPEFDHLKSTISREKIGTENAAEGNDSEWQSNTAITMRKEEKPTG